MPTTLRLLFVAMLAAGTIVALPAQEPAADTAAAKARLQEIAAAANLAVDGWAWTLDGQTWEDYKLGQGLNASRVGVRARIPCREVVAGVPVLGTPTMLKLKLYARGLVDVTVRQDDRVVQVIRIDGGGDQGVEVVKEVFLNDPPPITGSTIDLEAVNAGRRPPRGEFWPPRRNPLPETGLVFAIRGAELDYLEARPMVAALRDWVDSLQTAERLIWPELVRYTFTRRPYPIEDRRGVPPERLALLGAAYARAVQALDLDAVKRGSRDRLETSLKQSLAETAELRRYAQEFKVHLIGNAHIDIAWLWRMAETREVARNTYATVLKNMDEYPELVYAQSQALTYRWMEERDPQLFRQIAQRIADGRWEVVGGTWVEPDCNLISGESWVRQLLFGKRYFKEKFGADVTIGWNPDSFGYNWNMPQLYRKSGLDVFITQKIWWNDTTVFPHFVFWWEGPDGTRLLTYFPPEGYTSRVDLAENADAITKYQATTGWQKSLILYGLGDHGGGPNREILDRVRRYGRLPVAPQYVHTKAGDFLKQIAGELGERIPVWRDELYLEYHRGTFTSQAQIKQNNRRCEAELGAAEKAATWARLLGAAYPRADLAALWQDVLTNQFHDILPGSSITPVYRDALETYATVRRKLDRIEDQALRRVGAAVDTSRIEGIPVVVFNPLAWERADFVTAELPASSGELALWTVDGKPVPAEFSRDAETGALRVAFVAENVPSLGYRVFVARSGSPGPAVLEVKADQTFLENRWHRLEVDPESGRIRSFRDKKLDREFVAPGQAINALRIYEDIPENWDAWNLGFTGRVWQLDQAAAVELVHASPVRAVLRVRHNFLGPDKDRYAPTENFPSSTFTQTITVYRALDRVDIATEADWWESHLMLKAAFPLSVTSDLATYEIPFAAIARSTRRETLAEKARFEVPALRWADLADAAGGISVLNDSKHGYDIHGSEIELSLLRAPTWPDPMADRGRHAFTYSLYTHAGSWADGATVRRGAELNTPLRAWAETRHPGKLPTAHSFAAVDTVGVVLDTVKLAEDGDALVFRFYESLGRPDRAVLQLPVTPAKVSETDLMENPIRDLAPAGATVTLDFGKFEIKTLRVALPPR